MEIYETFSFPLSTFLKNNGFRQKAYLKKYIHTYCRIFFFTTVSCVLNHLCDKTEWHCTEDWLPPKPPKLFLVFCSMFKISFVPILFSSSLTNPKEKLFTPQSKSSTTNIVNQIFLILSVQNDMHYYQPWNRKVNERHFFSYMVNSILENSLHNKGKIYFILCHVRIKKF